MKGLSTVILLQITEECEAALPNWQFGFRNRLGTRHPVLILKLLTQKIIELGRQVNVTYLDFSAAFDSMSMLAIDTALQAAGASRKSRAMVRAIYGVARAHVENGEDFRMTRGCLQGDALSPFLFIITLWWCLRDADGAGMTLKGVHIDKLGFADDIAIIDLDATSGTISVTNIANECQDLADMVVNISKTESMTVQPDDENTKNISQQDIDNIVKKYTHSCECCPDKAFKTWQGLQTHHNNHCPQAKDNCNADTGTILQMLDHHGPPNRRWHQVKWMGRNDSSIHCHNTAPGDRWTPSWEPAANVDQSPDANKNHAVALYWEKNPHAIFNDDNHANHQRRCVNCNHACKSSRGVAHHQACSSCRPPSNHTPTSAKPDAMRKKRADRASAMPKACINGTQMKNVSNFRHLGTQQEANASTDFDVHARLNLARVRFNEMHCTFKSTTLSTSLKLRLFKVCTCTVARYGSESWNLTAATRRKIRGWCAKCLATITKRTHAEEARPSTTAFDLVLAIRAQRTAWLGQMLRYSDKDITRQALLAWCLTEDDKMPAGSLLNDAPAFSSLDHLCSIAKDEEAWTNHAATLSGADDDRQ